MTRFRARHAWLGGPAFAEDVVFEVDQGRFRSVGAGTGTDQDVVLEGVVLPGLVSAHSHAFHRVLRGSVWGGGDFWAWRDTMYRVAGRLDPGLVREVATAVFGEMLAAGITRVGEFHYLHHRPGGDPYADPNVMGVSLAEAARAAGIRLTIVDTCYLTSEVDGAPPDPDQARFSDGTPRRWIERMADLSDRMAGDPLVTVAGAVHSVRAVPPDAIEMVAAATQELGVPLHIHVSEQRAENEASLRVHGLTPVGLLAELGTLGPSTVLVHATHLTDDDVGLVGSSGSRVCLCPTTERDLGDGLGVAADLAAAGVPLCLGSDSNAVVDLFEEARGVEMADRLRLERRGVHDPVALLEAATAGGAAALGGEGGRLSLGQPADFILVDTGGAAMAGVPLTPEGVMASAGARDVEAVWVAGERKAPGRHPGETSTLFEALRT
jgi:formiminoglutamate deiminase